MFKTIISIHALEVVYGLFRCRKLGLTTGTTLKWLVSIGFNGVLALKMLNEPEKYYNAKQKTQ